MSSSNAAPDTGSESGNGHEPTTDDPEREGSEGPVCPFCGSEDAELESTFGSEVSKSQYYCNNCHTVFERIKFDGAMPDTGRDRDGAR